MHKNLFVRVLVLLVLGLFSGGVSAMESQEEGKKTLEIGPMIIDHVLDEHSWHICEVGGKHIAVPLPVLLIDDGNFYAFSSSRLAHEHIYEATSVGGKQTAFFQLRETAPYKGRIVKWVNDEEGTRVIAEKMPVDLSITKNVVGVFVSSLLIFVIFMIVRKNYKNRGVQPPSGLASLIEPLVVFVKKDIAYANLGPKQGERFLPYLLTLFSFILFSNLLGIIPFIPFGANLTGNIAVALVLALFTWINMMVFSSKSYWKHVFNAPGVPWWMKFPLPIMPLIDFVEIFTKPVILMIRLFANILAGHIILLGFVALIFVFGELAVGLGYAISPVAVLFGLFIDALELLVAFVQAYVFTLLTSMYLATSLHCGPDVEEH